MSPARALFAREPRSILALVVCGGMLGCTSVTGPHGTLADGRWAGDGACLAVANGACNLVVGCGHGQFPAPVIRGDGTFDVDGTYRIEVGPISPNPAPPAHFSGSAFGLVLTLRVVPTTDSLLPASYAMRPSGPGACLVPCL